MVEGETIKRTTVVAHQQTRRKGRRRTRPNERRQTGLVQPALP